MERVFLLTGTNLGNRLENLKNAADAISKNAGEIVQSSAIYKTAAWGKTNQADFYNQVLEITTSFSPEDLLKTLLSIERDMGRQRIEKWGARLIDIDILFYGNEVYQSPSLTIPHDQISLRKFTLVPLAEIAPQLEHPVFHKTMDELLQNCPDTLPVVKL
jgi:2-amino-4-hydroxy-6-hydroxymethyldihydropteridine diphosphokinase